MVPIMQSGRFKNTEKCGTYQHTNIFNVGTLHLGSLASHFRKFLFGQDLANTVLGKSRK
jgi:hypothetical protein